MKNLGINDNYYQEIEQFKLEYKLIKVFYKHLLVLNCCHFLMQSIKLFIKKLSIVFILIHMFISPSFKTFLYDFIIIFTILVLYAILDSVFFDLSKKELDDDYFRKVRTEMKKRKFLVNNMNNYINLNPDFCSENIQNKTEKIIQDIYNGRWIARYEDVVKLYNQYKENLTYLERYNL